MVAQPAEEITEGLSVPVVENDPAAITRVVEAVKARGVADVVVEGPLVTGSEDFGHFATRAGCPGAFWFVGVTDAEKFQRAVEAGRMAEDVPFNHSPHFAPVPDPGIRIGIDAMTAAALAWLEPRP